MEANLVEQQEARRAEREAEQHWCGYRPIDHGNGRYVHVVVRRDVSSSTEPGRKWPKRLPDVQGPPREPAQMHSRESPHTNLSDHHVPPRPRVWRRFNQPARPVCRLLPPSREKRCKRVVPPRKLCSATPCAAHTVLTHTNEGDSLRRRSHQTKNCSHCLRPSSSPMTLDLVNVATQSWHASLSSGWAFACHRREPASGWASTLVCSPRVIPTRSG